MCFRIPLTGLRHGFLILAGTICVLVNYSSICASCGGPPPLPDIDTISPGVYSIDNVVASPTITYDDSLVSKLKALFSAYEHIGLAKAVSAHCITDTSQARYRPMECTIEIEVLESYKGDFIKMEHHEIFLSDIADGNEGFYDWIIGKEFLIYSNSIDSLPANVNAGCYSHNYGYYHENGRIYAPCFWIGPSVSIEEFVATSTDISRKSINKHSTFNTGRKLKSMYTVSGKKIDASAAYRGMAISENGKKKIIVRQYSE